MQKFMKTVNIRTIMNIIHQNGCLTKNYEYFFKKVLTTVNKHANIGNVVRNDTKNSLKFFERYRK